jgi:hypothetical protein
MIDTQEQTIDQRIEALLGLAQDKLMPHEQALALIEMYVNEVMSPIHRAMWLAEKVEFINQLIREG